VIFFRAGIKEDGLERQRRGGRRRWRRPPLGYLHYFKEGQPSLNWLDPSFAAPQMIVGDALHSVDVLGARGLRLDANGFLGVERQPAGRPGRKAPAVVVGNQLIGGMIRKAGPFSFQELNLTVDDIAAMSTGRRRPVLRLHHPAGLPPRTGDGSTASCGSCCARSTNTRSTRHR
jgi:trehalose synthase